MAPRDNKQAGRLNIVPTNAKSTQLPVPVPPPPQDTLLPISKSSSACSSEWCNDTSQVDVTKQRRRRLGQERNPHLSEKQTAVILLNQCGTTHFRNGKHNAAMKAYKKALGTIQMEVHSIPEEDDDDSSVEDWGDSESMEDSKGFKRTTRQFQKDMGIIILTQTLNSIGTIHWRQGDLTSSMVVLEEAQDVVRATNGILPNTRMRTSSNSLSSLAGLKTSRSSSSLSNLMMGSSSQNHLNEKDAVFIRKGRTIAEVSIMVNMGIVYYLQNKLSDALVVLTQALQLQRRIITISKPSSEKNQSYKTNEGNHSLRLAQIINLIATVHLKGKNYVTSLRMYKDVLRTKKLADPSRHQTLKQRNDKDWNVYDTQQQQPLTDTVPMSTAITLLNLGHVHTQTQEYDTALSFYYEALRIQQSYYSNSNQHIDVGVTLHHIGRVHQLQNNIKEALKYYKTVLTIYESNSLSDSHLIMASLWKNIAEAEVERARMSHQEFAKKHTPHAPNVRLQQEEKKRKARKMLRLGLH